MSSNNANQQLTDLLVSKNFEPQSLDAQGKPATNPEDATMFSFDYTGESGKDYGTVVIMADEDNNLNVYFGDNLGKGMEGDDKKGWFDFLQQIRQFSKRNMMTFSLQNLNKLKYSLQGQAALKEGLFEGWSGKKDLSWNAAPTEARLVIKHKKNLGEGEARFRYIESLFIETADGERYRMPFKSLTAGKAMLEHVRQGGKPYDIRGNHIATIVEELNLLSRFRRANQGKIFEGETQQLVEEATQYFETLKHNLKTITTRTGYKKYFESWNPAALTDEDVIIEDLRHLFVEQNIDTRVEQALPLLAKLKQEHAMKEINVFESMMTLITEGTWALPDTPQKQQQLIQLLSDELPVGADATNATELLYDLLGDDALFDELHALAQQDANADARTIIINRLEQLKDNPQVAQVIGKLKIETTPQGEEPVDEGQSIYHNGRWVPQDSVDKNKIMAVKEDRQLNEFGDHHYRVTLRKEGGAKRTIDLKSPAGSQVSPQGLANRYLAPGEYVSDVLPLDEVSNDLVNNYKDKAWDEFAQGNDKRGAGILRARAKQHGEFGHVKTTDESQLDELSPKTLGSYIKRASSDRAQRNFDQGFDSGSTMNARTPKFDVKNSRKDDQRRSGIHKAVNRLTTEEYQELAELSPNTLKSYIKKAASSSDERSASNLASRAADKLHSGGEDDGEADDHKSFMRSKGIARATDRLEEGGMSEVDLLLQELARGTVDMYAIYANPKTNVEKFVSNQIHDRVEELTKERPELRHEADIDKVLDIIKMDLEDEYGVDESVGGGNFLESTGDRTALQGQYGHSGRLQEVTHSDPDIMDRIKFLAGLSK